MRVIFTFLRLKMFSAMSTSMFSMMAFTSPSVSAMGSPSAEVPTVRMTSPFAISSRAVVTKSSTTSLFSSMRPASLMASRMVPIS